MVSSGHGQKDEGLFLRGRGGEVHDLPVGLRPQGVEVGQGVEHVVHGGVEPAAGHLHQVRVLVCQRKPGQPNTVHAPPHTHTHTQHNTQHTRTRTA